MNPYIDENNQPTDTLNYTLRYFGVTVEQFKQMSDKQVTNMVKYFSDVLNDGKDYGGWSGQNHNTEFNPYGGNSLNESATTREGYFEGYDNHGSFSRYYDLDKWWEERIKSLPENVRKVFPFLIEPKAAKSEKNYGTEGMEYLDKPKDYDGFTNHPRPSKETKAKNNHPTVKPLKLMSYLITLGSREGDIILEPFAGSGTTCIAARLLNRNFIAAELSPEYHKIAEARIKQFTAQQRLF